MNMVTVMAGVNGVKRHSSGIVNIPPIVSVTISPKKSEGDESLPFLLAQRIRCQQHILQSMKPTIVVFSASNRKNGNE
jgi:hypothetical protein